MHVVVPAGSRVAMGLMFYPRGGSAFVVRELVPRLTAAGWPTTLYTGSLGAPGEATHAGTFYAGLPVVPHDYSDAVRAAAAGEDPLDQPQPLHPSYEDRPGALDRILTSVSPALAERQVQAWELTFAAGRRPDLVHLHHLTPMAEAAARTWPGCPTIAHLHGTELKMLAEIARRRVLPGGLSGAAWRYTGYWVDRMRSIARRADRLVVVSPADVHEVGRLLEVDPDRLAVVPNGVDVERFDRRITEPSERLARWHRWLVDEPLGWDESGRPGSVSYTDRDLAAFVDPATGGLKPVLLYVGRFTAVKRLDMLLRAYARLRARLGDVAPLVVWGGSPGEWEGEHPVTQVRREGTEGVFFIGMRGHDDLPDGLACADLMVAPSTGESFGQVYLEAMACGVPVVATLSGGPPSFINTVPGEADGWLIPPDDEDALLEVLVEALTSPQERQRRGDNAYAQVRARYSWSAGAAQLAAVYAEVVAASRSSGGELPG
jgi:glycosyltransferase involved in cell wall biosynthesis